MIEREKMCRIYKAQCLSKGKGKGKVCVQNSGLLNVQAGVHTIDIVIFSIAKYICGFKYQILFYKIISYNKIILIRHRNKFISSSFCCRL
jgi:hypothetical protein